MSTKRHLYVLLFALFNVISFLPGTSFAINVTGTLYNNTRWTKTMSPVILTGDVTVSKNATLTIDPGVEVRAATSDGQRAGVNTSKVELIIQGKLNAIGTSSSWITFKGSTSSSGTWYGIRVLSGATASIRYAKIEYPQHGLENYGTTTISDYSIGYASSYGMYPRGGTLTAVRGAIYRGSYGVYYGGGTIRLSYTRVYRNRSYGIYASTSTRGTMWLDHNTISNNSRIGVYIYRSSSSAVYVTVQNNIITRNGGTGSSGYELYSGRYSLSSCRDNLIWDTSGNITYGQTCSNTTRYNPLFVNESRDDYRLYDRSPARKAGISGTDVGAFAWTTHKTGVWHGKLFVNTTMPAGTHTIPGDLIVAKGVTFTISPGANLVFSTRDDMYGGSSTSKGALLVLGNLIAQGSPSRRIVFRGSTSTQGIWDGIRVRGTSTLRFVSIQYPQYGFENYGTSSITDYQIGYASSYGMYPRGGTLTAVRGAIYRGSYGVYYGGGTIRLSYTRVYRNRSYGIYASTSTRGTMWLDHNTISNNSRIGVYIYRSSSSAVYVTVQNNIITRNGGTGSSGYELYSGRYSLSSCRNNLIWDTSGNTTYGQTCSSTVRSNPLFVNESRDDYHLTATSPARKKATDGSDLGALPFKATLSQILVTPNPGKVIVAKTLQFKAEGLDSSGGIISGQTFTWKVIKGGGSINSSGLFTAGTKAGTFTGTVEASIGSVKGYATVTITADKTTKVVVVPNPAKIAAGQSSQLKYTATDKYGNITSPKSVSWKVTSSAGTISTAGLLKVTTKAGTYANAVTVTADGVSGTGTIQVTPYTLSKITVTPNPGKVAPKKNLQFAARGSDAYGNVISGVKYTWKIVKGGGTIDPTGLFTADSKAGTYTNTVEASSGSVKGYATVQVTVAAPKVASVIITPAAINLKPGGTQLFRASAKDSQGKTVSGQSFKWSLPKSGGTLKVGSGLHTQATFTAGSASGTYILEAETAGVKATASILISAGKAPTTPVLLSPKDKSSIKTAKPVLELSNSTDPDKDKISYNFEVASDALFSTKVATGTVAETPKTTKWTVSKTLTEDKTYYWRARATDGKLNSAWSKTWSFTVNVKNGAPTAPKLSSPVDGGQVASLQPELEVTNATDPEKQALVYVYEVATDAQMKKVVVRSAKLKEGGAGSTRWKVSTALKDGTKYYWHAWAIDSDGLAGAKMKVATFSISLSNKPPSAPKPRKPKDGEVVKTKAPAFEITNSTDPEGKPVTLDIEVDTKNTFDSSNKIAKTKLPQSSSGITIWTISKDLSENTTYFWRVRASDGKATTAWVFGGEFTVNSQNDPPTAPTPKAPADGTTVDGTDVKLVIENATDPDKDTLTYHFQAGEDQNFGGQLEEKKAIQERKGGTYWQPAALDKGKTYYWRVRAHDGTEYGPWSKVSSFTISVGNQEAPAEVPTEAPEEVPTEATPDASGENPGTPEKTTGEQTPESSTNDDGGSTTIDQGQSGQPDKTKQDSEVPPGGCGCSTEESGSTPTLFFLLLFAALVFFRRQNAPKRS